MTKENKGLEAYIQVDFITKENAKFHIKAYDNISVTYGKETYDHVRFYRSFPLTNKSIFISVKDSEDKEIGLIKDLKDLENPILEQKIEDKLAIRYFCPTIETIVNLKEEYGYCYFTTQTSAGPREFIVNRHDRPILKLDKGDQYQIMDMDGNRYVMKAFTAYEDKYIKIIENML